MRGLVDKADQDSEKNMIPPKADKRSGKRSMRHKVRTRAESGICNVCSAPCSSCMHLKLSYVGSNDGEMSDETCHTAAMSQNSINNNQRTISEAGNLLYAKSCHDSLTENAESKVKVESLDAVDTSVDSKMVPKRVEQLSLKLQSSTEQGTCSSKQVVSKLIEGLDDNTSCVSKANEESTVVSYFRKNIVKKNVLGNSGPESGGSIQEEFAATTSDVVNCENSSGENTTVKNTVKAADKIFPELGAEDKDCRNRPDEVLEGTDQSGPEKKFDMSVELHNIQEPALHSLSGDDNDESEIIEHDVKVCDICGDAGREDLLAICSRCSDGAEHTYCMREMLDKVPEGDWLCEECKLAEEVDNQKPGADTEAKTATKSSSIVRTGKRHAETTEVLPSKKQAFEASSGSPKTSSSGRAATLSRESSFKSIDKAKVKPDYHNPVVNQSTVDASETAHQPSSGVQIQTPRGALSKSNSFNTLCSNPKARIVDEVPQKVKVAKEHSSVDVKEGPARNMSKSMSFKSVNLGRANGSESKVKMLPSDFPHKQEMKGLKSVRDRIAFERKNSLRLDRPLGNSLAKVDQKLTPRGDSSMMSSESNNKEFKISQSDENLCNLSRSDSNMVRKGTELPVLFAQGLSANGTDNASADSRINEVSAKDEPSSSSSGAAEKSSKKDNGNFSECSPWARESLSQIEKTKESSVSCSTPCAVVSPRNATYQKSKGVGHAAEYGTVSSRVTAVDASMSRSVREVNHGSKLKAAIEAAMLKKPGICRKKEEREQSDGLSSSNVAGSVRIASHDRVPALNKIKDIKFNGENPEERVGFGMLPSESCKQSSGNLVKQLNGHAVDGSFPVKAEDMDPVDHAVGKLNALASVASLKVLAIPECGYVWQGAFEVCKSGRDSEWCGGIQAHLSTSASPKVFEVVKRFPQTLILYEVPRLSTWPRQFYVDGARDDNIALFFFAKDDESFEKYYNGLLNDMIRKDLALKTSLDGVDLLMFPSTLLPESSQRWNTLFFVWGVFSGRRPDYSVSLKKSVVSDPDEVPLNNPKSSAVISKDGDSCLPTPVDKEVSVSDCSSEKAPASAALSKQCAQSNGDSDKKLSNFLSSSKQQDYTFDSKSLSKSTTKSPWFCTEARSVSPLHEKVDLAECKPDMELEFSCQATGAFGSNGKEDTQMNRDVSREREDASSSHDCCGGNQDLHSRGSCDVEKTRVGIQCEKIKVERDLNEENESMDIEGSLRDLNIEAVENENLHPTSRKRQYLDLSEAASPTSGSMSDKMQWNEACTLSTESESISKKPRTDLSRLYGSISSGDGIIFGNKLPSQGCDLASSSLSEKSYAEVYDERATLKTLGTNERHFFPMDLDNAKNSHLVGSFLPCKENSSNDIHQLSDGVPNLELALGAEKKSENMGMFPFFRMVDKNNSHNRSSDKMTNKEEEDESASLSLSLSFPFSNKEPSRKPEPKREQRQHVNASLVLFGGFPEK